MGGRGPARLAGLPGVPRLRQRRLYPSALYRLQPEQRNDAGAHNYSGWFASIGVDTTFPLLGNGWFFRSDFRYSQYGSATLAEVNAAGTVIDLQSIRPAVQAVTAGLIYKFNSGVTTAPGAGFSFGDFLRAPRGPSHWTGLYVAGGGGYGTWAAYSTALSPGGVPLASTTNGGRGWFGTVNGGYDYQLTDRLRGGCVRGFRFREYKGNLPRSKPAGAGSRRHDVGTIVMGGRSPRRLAHHAADPELLQRRLFAGEFFRREIWAG